MLNFLIHSSSSYFKSGIMHTFTYPYRHKVTLEEMFLSGNVLFIYVVFIYLSGGRSKPHTQDQTSGDPLW